MLFVAMLIKGVSLVAMLLYCMMPLDPESLSRYVVGSDRDRDSPAITCCTITLPSSDDLFLIVRHAYTPASIDTESEPEEAPSEIEELLPLVSKAPLTDEEFEASEPSYTRTT
ncbi:hypothetical protein Tco_1304062 [Tanacetum coccineum]